MMEDFDNGGFDGLLYWHCTDSKSCNGRIQTDNGNPSNWTSHNHPSSKVKTLVQTVCT